MLSIFETLKAADFKIPPAAVCCIRFISTSSLLQVITFFHKLNLNLLTHIELLSFRVVFPLLFDFLSFPILASEMTSFISPQVFSSTNFNECILSNDLEQLDKAISTRPYILNQNLVNGEETLLLRSCIEKKKKVIKFLLKKGADPNVQCAKFQNETGKLTRDRHCMQQHITHVYTYTMHCYTLTYCLLLPFDC